MTRGLRLLLLLLLLVAVRSEGAEPLAVDGRGQIPLSGHLELLRDPGGRLSFGEVLRAAEAGRFQPLPGNLSEGYGAEVLWLRVALDLVGSAPANRILEVPPAYVEDLRCYPPGAGPGAAPLVAGAAVPQPLDATLHRIPRFRLHLQRGETGVGDVLYLRLVTRSRRIAQPVLWTEQAFQEASLRKGFLFGGYFGIFVLILLSNLIYWHQLRERIHLHFAGFVAVMIGINGGNTGHLQALVVPLQPWIAIGLFHLSLVLFLELNRRVFSDLVGLERALPTLHQWYRRGSLAITGVAVASVFLGHYFHIAEVYLNLVGVSLLANLVLCILLLSRGHRLAWLYLIPFGPIVVFGLLMVSRNFLLAWAPRNLDVGWHLASLTYLLLMSVLVGYKIQLIKGERDHLREEAERAAEAYREQLEHRVQERTAELQAEKRLAEEALDSVNRMVAEQRRFIATIGHEFRTPLSIIDGAAQVAEGALGAPPPAVQSQFAKIRRGVRRLLLLLDNSLSRDRIGSGKWEARFQAFDLNPFLEDLVAQAQPLAETHTLRVQGAPSPVPVLGDPALLALAIQNLLDNAVKYSPAGSDVRVALVAGPAGQPCIEVRDRGMGIPEDERGHVFERFFRGRGVGRVAGAGLGLDLVRHITELHGGAVEVADQAGGGTVFRLILPLASQMTQG